METLRHTIEVINELLDANNLSTQVETEQAIFLADELSVLRHALAIVKRYNHGAEA
jgi:hypothetical protein